MATDTVISRLHSNLVRASATALRIDFQLAKRLRFERRLIVAELAGGNTVGFPHNHLCQHDRLYGPVCCTTSVRRWVSVSLCRVPVAIRGQSQSLSLSISLSLSNRRINQTASSAVETTQPEHAADFVVCKQHGVQVVVLQSDQNKS